MPIEYSHCTKDMLSKKHVMKEGKAAFGRQVKLMHVSTGYEPAGSMMRLVEECFRVQSYDPSFNSYHSNDYQWHADAIDHFNMLTKPIVAVEA